MASDPKEEKWTISRLIPKRLLGASGITAAGMLISGAADINGPAQAGQTVPPKVGKDDAAQRRVQSLISDIKTALQYEGQAKRKATKGEIRTLIGLLGSNVFSDREKATKTLIDIGYPARHELKTALRNPDLEIARRARIVLATFAPIEQERANQLRWPVWELDRLLPQAKAAVPVLMEVLEEGDPHILRDVMVTLGYLGANAQAAVPKLAEHLTHRDEDVRRDAAQTLGAIGPGAKGAVPALIHALKDKNGDVPAAAAYALGQMGPGAKPAVSPLLALLKRVDKISAKETVVESTRQMVMVSLGHIGAEAKLVVPALEAEFQRGNQETRYTVVKTLGKFTSEAKDAILPILTTALTDEDWWVKRGAIESLVRMGRDARGAISALKALRDSEPSENELDEWGLATCREIRQRAGAAIDAIEKTRAR
jgi:HEAT repeat protein